MDGTAWNGFRGGLWQTRIDVRDFIQQNYTPYDGDEAFLTGATARTKRNIASAYSATLTTTMLHPELTRTVLFCVTSLLLEPTAQSARTGAS